MVAEPHSCARCGLRFEAQRHVYIAATDRARMILMHHHSTDADHAWLAAQAVKLFDAERRLIADPSDTVHL